MSFYDDLNDRFRELHSDIAKAIENLSVEALDWIPGPEMNPINVLVVHLTGAERYWIGVALYDPPERDREAEFRTEGLSTDELKVHIDSAGDYARQALARLSLPVLEAPRLSRVLPKQSRSDGAWRTRANIALFTRAISS